MQKIWFIDEGLDKMGGVERVINTLSNDLIKDYDIELISVYKSNDKPYFNYNEKIKINYMYDKSNLTSKKFKKIKPLYYLFRFFEKKNQKKSIKKGVFKYYKKIEEDDIVVFGRIPVALMFLPYIKKAKKIIVREAVHLYFLNKKQQSEVKELFKKVDLLVISSSENKKIYEDFFDYDINIQKIYNPLGIIPKKVTSYDSKTVISVGRYDTHKGYDYLIRSFKLVLEKHPDWKLNIVGDGYYKEKMAQLIKNLKLEQSVILVPSTKDVVSKLIDSSIYVMASRFEGYANALVEAMACGLACISYDWLVGVSDIIEDGVNGEIVPLTDRFRYFNTLEIIDEDITNLANTINKLIEDRELREKYGKEAEKIIESRKAQIILEKWRNYILEGNDEKSNN